jgi:hypothetical protein
MWWISINWIKAKRKRSHQKYRTITAAIIVMKIATEIVKLNNRVFLEAIDIKII